MRLLYLLLIFITLSSFASVKKPNLNELVAPFCPLSRPPSNNLFFNSSYMYPVEAFTTSTVTEEYFYKNFYEVIDIYKKQLKQLHKPIDLKPDWKNPYFSAYTFEQKETLEIGIWGGMARIPGMNNEAIVLIACHELGHLLGGAPFIPIKYYKNISSEGQSDYFATKQCIKKFFSKNYNTKETPILNKVSTPEAKSICYLKSNAPKEYQICLKTMRAIEGFSHVIAQLHHHQGSMSLSSKDETITSKTINIDYPKNQCRIDTYIAGYFNKERPKCWYKAD